MMQTDWTNKEWLKAKTSKPARRMGACLWCGARECGCHQDDIFGAGRARAKVKDDRQPLLQLIPREGE